MSSDHENSQKGAKIPGKKPDNVSEEEWNRTNSDYSSLWNNAKVPEDEEGEQPKPVNIAEEEWNRENADYSKIWKNTGLDESGEKAKE